MKTQNKTLSTAELAELLSVSTGRIRQIALSLGLERKGRDWLFDKTDVDKIATHTRVGGAPCPHGHRTLDAAEKCVIDLQKKIENT